MPPTNNLKTALIALGGNIDNPREHLESALEKIRSRNGWRLLAQSGWFVTKPVGFAEQPDFINAAAAIGVPAEISPEKMLEILLETEISEGRVRPKPFPDCPRTCDLDLIFFENETRNTGFLTLPHPRWREREFVLLPLIEVLEKINDEKRLAEARTALAKIRAC